jgi:catechol 2,3-dioxygenase-like lactoylglutathione lyase family enzyme
MPLHRMNQITIGVPDVEKTSDFYRDFGLEEREPGAFSTADGGEQLRLVHSPLRRLIELAVGADNPDDVDRVASQISRLDVDVERTEDGMAATDPGTGVRVRVDVAPRLRQEPEPETPYNGPGRIDRLGRAPKIQTEEPKARPRKLGHVVIGTTALEASQKFFMEGIGFKLSDQVGQAAFFLRCSEDHHNLLLQSAPVQFLHHTSWQVEDVDAIGLGAQYLSCRRTQHAMSGDSAGTTSDRTSSGTSATLRATSPSTTPTWTASRTTRYGSPRCGKA